jgi:hypothetical protein
MKYELIKTDNGPDSEVIDGKYICNITIGLHPTDNFTPDFSKTITVESLNSATGDEVDAQRIQSITDYLTLINQ